MRLRRVNKCFVAYGLMSVLLFTACGSDMQESAVGLSEAEQVKIEVSQNAVEKEVVSWDVISEDMGNEEAESQEEGLEEIPEATEIPKEPEPAEIHLIMVGDMLMHERVMESGLKEDGSYNFDHLFVHVKEKIESADLALVNQETILGGTELGLTGYPCFNSPYELGVAEVEAGFDVILHGTNHALDKGKTGALNCMDFWEEQYPHITYLGIHSSQEAQDNNLYVYEQDGMRIAILNYTYGTNGISTPKDMPYLVDYMEKEKVIDDLKQAEELADFTVVCPHWGTEYSLGISDEQEYWTQIFLENGVDLVLGTHPHVIEPIEWVKDEDGHTMLVYYSLGNFVNGTSGTGEGVMNRCVGGMAEVTIGRDEKGKVVILEYDAIPLVCHIAEGEEYTVWYLEDYTQELAQENLICSQDEAFSLENCESLVRFVWGNLDQDSDENVQKVMWDDLDGNGEKEYFRTEYEDFCGRLQMYFNNELIYEYEEELRIIGINEKEYIDLDNDEKEEIFVSFLPAVNSMPLEEWFVLKEGENGWELMEMPHYKDDMSDNAFPISITLQSKEFELLISCEGYEDGIVYDATNHYERKKKEQEEWGDTSYERFIEGHYQVGNRVGYTSAWGIWNIENGTYDGQNCLIAEHGLNGPNGKYDFYGCLYVYFNYDAEGKIQILNLEFKEAEY